MLEEFKTHVRGRGLSIDDDAFAQDVDFIRAMLRYQIDEALFSVEEARRNLFDVDPQTQYAGTLFDEAERLLETSGKPSVVASR